VTTTRRKKDDTLGSLGRAPARTGGTTRLPSYVAPRPPTQTPPDDGSGRIKEWLREAFLGNLGLKFLSLVLALTVFLLINTDREREITARVGVSYTLPEDRVLVSQRLTELRVTVRGPSRQLRRFDEREIDRIELDLRNVSDGEIAITPDMVRLPSGLTLTSISPRTLRVAFEKRVERPVEVTPIVAGRPKHGYTVHRMTSDPAMVTVAGAEGVIKALASVRTREIRIDGRDEPFIATTELVPPDGVEVSTAEAPVTVSIDIKEQLETRRLGRIAVRVLGDGVDPIAVLTDPPAVDVVLTGTVRAVDAAVDAGITPTVKITAADVARRRSVPIAVTGLPPGVGIELVPAKVEVAPVPKGGVKPKPDPVPAPAPAPAPVPPAPVPPAPDVTPAPAPETPSPP
jgi:YbbR domain-containing protein